MTKVLNIFQQMFSRDSSDLDELIVDQMGYMVMVGPAGGPGWSAASAEAPLTAYSTNHSFWWDDEDYGCVTVDPSNNQVYQQIMKLFASALCGSSTHPPMEFVHFQNY